MELDELKKSWSALDERLKKGDLMNEETVSNLIRQRTCQTRGLMNKLLRNGMISIMIGIVLLLLVSSYLIFVHQLRKEDWFWLFIGGMLIFGLIWDWVSYRYLKKINIEEMPLVMVIERINTFHHYFMIECIVAGIIFLVIIIGQVLMNGIWQQPLLTKIMFGIIWLITIFATFFTIKKLYYNRLKEIRKNISELKELKKTN